MVIEFGSNALTVSILLLVIVILSVCCYVAGYFAGQTDGAMEEAKRFTVNAKRT